MARFRFELATAGDDEGLRAVLRETTMPGQITLQFLREPSFFEGNCVLGQFQQTIVCRNVNSGEIVGFGCRSIRDATVNGMVRPVGYLSMLRLKPAWRSIGLVSRGYRFLRELDADGRADFYLTTIAEGNQTAIDLLTSGRAGLPQYDFEGRYSTFVISAGKRLSTRLRPSTRQRLAGMTLRNATEADCESIISFLEQEAESRRYFPRYQRADFGESDGTFRNIAPENIVLAVGPDDRIAGTMAFWDQRQFRQTVVSGYQGLLNRVRPLYNLWAGVAGKVVLPPPGHPLNYGFVAFPVVATCDEIAGKQPELLTAMLQRLLSQARRSGLDYLLMGCHETDPGWTTVSKLSSRQYSTRIYRVTWEDRKSTAVQKSLDNAAIASAAMSHPEYTPYLELGCL